MDSTECTPKPHAELYAMRDKLRGILHSASSFSPSIAKPPIIDSSFDLAGNPTEDIQRQDAIKGLRALKDSVKRDLEVLEKFLADPNHARQPALSTNAPYLASVWNEVLLAPPPVTAIWSTYSESGRALNPRRRGLPKEAGVKVDVVADGGKRWIRVNTTRNSRMLAEFREIDSYLTDSDENSEEAAEDGFPSLAQSQFDNSILRTARSLLAAAKENPIPGTSEIPAVTLRLTRLDLAPPNEKNFDPRITRTIDELCALGIDVQLGERTDTALSERMNEGVARTPQLYPTRCICLDLSILIALVSDLTHATLPVSAEDAEARFTPSSEYIAWKKKRIASLKNSAAVGSSDELTAAAEPEADFITRPSRALVSQVLQEMAKGLFQDMFERLDFAGNSSSTVEFWTTPEARDRCLQIVTKIGGPREKRRAEALFSSADVAKAEREFWLGSRYPHGFISLFPIHLFPPGEPGEDDVPPPRSGNEMASSPFFPALAKTCRAILAQETMPHPRALPLPRDDVDDLGEIQRATVTKANPRLTAHTVQSMLWGAVRGWTTLTANKTSVKAMLREMRAARGGALWDQGDEKRLGFPLPSSNGTASQMDDRAAAAMWMVDPRSLAEGMRAELGTY